MKIVEIVRMEESEEGTLGALKIDKQLFCCTLEPPDFLNHSNISCIPVQQYWCGAYSSQKYPNTFQIMNVPDRSKVLFHAGNTIDDTAGCVILGRNWGVLSGERAVLNSGDTFNRFLAHMANEGIQKFHLTIQVQY